VCLSALLTANRFWQLLWQQPSKKQGFFRWRRSSLAAVGSMN